VPDSQQRATVQAAIQTQLGTVTGLENVFAGLRRKLQPAEFIAAFRESDQTDLQASFVYRRTSQTRSAESARGQVTIRHMLHRHHMFQVEFYYNFKERTESSETTFQLLSDRILTAFNNTRSLGSWSSFPISLVESDYDWLGDVYCHHAVFQITVIEVVTGLVPS
jgi:hypothetical protein